MIRWYYLALLALCSFSSRGWENLGQNIMRLSRQLLTAQLKGCDLWHIVALQALENLWKSDLEWRWVESGANWLRIYKVNCQVGYIAVLDFFTAPICCFHTYISGSTSPHRKACEACEALSIGPSSWPSDDLFQSQKRRSWSLQSNLARRDKWDKSTKRCNDARQNVALFPGLHQLGAMP